MAQIKVLPESLVNKIAAGEVVERPASVVKELIENSIDAGASKIFIHTKDGGKSYIQVSDNGTGMDKEDAKLSFQRHSTSKISDPKDLFNITSLGFRGEALASIASVSKVTITTKTRQQMEGVKLEIEADQLKTTAQIASNPGTEIIVRDLFYNTPARKKHLSTTATENRHITDLVSRYALNYPQVFFRLVQDGKTVINSPSTTNTLHNISNIYGYRFTKQLLAVNYSSRDIEVMGFIGKPPLTKADKSYQSIYINGRYVKSETLSKALYDAYHTLVMVNRFPVAVLNVSIQPEQVDVNVHPTKRIVKFSDEKKVYSAVFDAVRETLQQNDLIPEAEARPRQEALARDKKTEPKKQEKGYAPEQSRQAPLETKKISQLPVSILGVVQNTYMVAEDRDNMLLIDQHAMHERILYDQFMKQFLHQKVEVQRLITPMMLELSPAELATVKSNLETLQQLGFETEDFGENTIVVRTIPVVLGRQQDPQLVSDIIAELHKQKSKRFDEIKEQVITRMSCRAAIKAGDDIPVSRLRELLSQLYRTGNFTCPHGRPIMVKFPVKDLEKKFKRVV